MSREWQPERDDADDAASQLQSLVEPLALLWTQPYADVDHRVSPAQLRVLFTLAWHGPQKLTALAERIAAIPSSATRLCDRLVAAGLVARELDHADRRVVTLSLTRDGQRLLDDLAQRRREALAPVLGAMAAEDREALLRGLQAFNAHVPRERGD